MIKIQISNLDNFIIDNLDFGFTIHWHKFVLIIFFLQFLICLFCICWFIYFTIFWFGHTTPSRLPHSHTFQTTNYTPTKQQFSPAKSCWVGTMLEANFLSRQQIPTTSGSPGSVQSAELFHSHWLQGTARDGDGAQDGSRKTTSCIPTASSVIRCLLGRVVGWNRGDVGVATCHGESPSAMHSLQGCWFRVEWKKFNISSLCSFFEKNLEENPVSYPSIALLRPRHDHVTKLGFRWFFRIVFTEGASSSCSLCSALHSSAAGWTMAGETEARRLRTNGFVFHGKAFREWIFPAMFFFSHFLFWALFLFLRRHVSSW